MLNMVHNLLKLSVVSDSQPLKWREFFNRGVLNSSVTVSVHCTMYTLKVSRGHPSVSKPLANRVKLHTRHVLTIRSSQGTVRLVK